jgi:hypothetical protein
VPDRGRPRPGRRADPRGLLVDAEKRLHDEGIAGEIYLFKNNTDSAGNSYGCHENYWSRGTASSAGWPTS